MSVARVTREKSKRIGKGSSRKNMVNRRTHGQRERSIGKRFDEERDAKENTSDVAENSNFTVCFLGRLGIEMSERADPCDVLLAIRRSVRKTAIPKVERLNKPIDEWNAPFGWGEA